MSKQEEEGRRFASQEDGQAEKHNIAPKEQLWYTNTHTRSRDKQRVSRLMESWPAMKDVPPREMSELGLGSRFFTMFSITLSTVSIRPLATTVDCCSTQTQSGFRLRLWVLLKQEIGVHPFKHNLPKSVARQPLRTNVGMNKTWITVA